MTVKYASLLFSLPFPFPRECPKLIFHDKTVLLSGSIKNQIEGPESKHWSEWLGTLTWESLCEDSLILSAWKESRTPEVLDKENQELGQTVSNIFRLLPLVAPLCPPFEEAYLLSGKGHVDGDKLVIEDVRSFSRVNCWTRSYYNEHHWQDFHDWAVNAVKGNALLDSWKECYRHYDSLFVQAQKNRQLFEAFRSFDEGMRGTQLEFKFPNLVRSLECIIDCWGFKEFAGRVLYLWGKLDPSLPYGITTDTEMLLQDLYQLRNDCSHGKPFAYSLEKKLGKAPDGPLVARYEFLAEWAARKILVDSFTNPSILANSDDRDGLVAAWKGGLIKP